MREIANVATLRLTLANREIAAKQGDLLSYELYRNYFNAQQNLYNNHFREHDADYEARVVAGGVAPVEPAIPAQEEYEEDAVVATDTAVRIVTIGARRTATATGSGSGSGGQMEVGEGSGSD